MVVTMFWVVPLVTVTGESDPDLPLRVTEIFSGGQVEKKPAVEPVPVNVAVMRVVPGMTAVTALVTLSMVATEVLPIVKERVPMELPQVGMALREIPVGRSQASAAVELPVTEEGAQSRTFEVTPSTVWL
jgi:hypothetical protein